MAKKSEQLDKRAKLLNLVRVWLDFDEYIDGMIKCIYQLNSHSNSNSNSSKIEKREILKAT